MSIDYLLGENDDISIVNGVVQFTDTIEQSSRQQVLISISTYRGEWEFNILAGIPYTKNANNKISILGKSSRALVDSYIKEDILARENIIQILSYESTLDKETRGLRITFEVETESGSTIVVGTENSPLIVTLG